MSDALTRELLAQVTAGILEESAFLFLEQAEEPPPFGEPVLQGRLSFCGGGFTGELILAACPQLGRTLSSSMLGIEPEEEAAARLGADALGETLNIMAGVLLERLSGGQPGWSLGLPRVATVAADVQHGAQSSCRCAVSFTTDDGLRIDAGATLEETAR
jgi:hypothetical protein